MKVFISYRRQDSEAVTGRLFDRLVQRYGRDNVYRDVDSIPFGDDFVAAIMNAIQQCDAMVVVIGTEWATVTDAQGVRRIDSSQDYVRIEIEQGLIRKLPILPVIVNNATMPKRDTLPVSIADLAIRNAAPIRPGRDFNPDVDAVIRDLDRLGAKPPGMSRWVRRMILALILSNVVLATIVAAVVLRQTPHERTSPETTATPVEIKTPQVSDLRSAKLSLLKTIPELTYSEPPRIQIRSDGQAFALLDLNPLEEKPSIRVFTAANDWKPTILAPPEDEDWKMLDLAYDAEGHLFVIDDKALLHRFDQSLKALPVVSLDVDPAISEVTVFAVLKPGLGLLCENNDKFRIFDFQTGKTVQNLNLTLDLTLNPGVSIDHAGSKFVTNHSDGQLRYWDAATGTIIRTFTPPNFGPDDFPLSAPVPPPPDPPAEPAPKPVPKKKGANSKPPTPKEPEPPAKPKLDYSKWSYEVLCESSPRYGIQGNTLFSGALGRSLAFEGGAPGRGIGGFAGLPNFSFNGGVMPAYSYGQLSRSGQYLAAVVNNGMIHLRDPETGRILGKGNLFGRDVPLSDVHDVLDVAFSPDGKTVVSAGSDHAVRFWDVPTAKLFHIHIGHADEVLLARFFPDGKRFLTLSRDRTLRIWEVSLKESGGQPVQFDHAPPAPGLGLGNGFGGAFGGGFAGNNNGAGKNGFGGQPGL